MALNILKVEGTDRVDLEGPTVRNHFPDQLLKGLKVVNRHTNEAVTEFWYEKSHIVYSHDRAESSFKYARIISLDSVQAELSSEITSATLMVAGVTSQLAFVADVWSTKEMDQQKQTLRALYTAVFFLGISVQVLSTLCTTLNQMRSSRFQADAWIGSHREWIYTMSKLFVLNFLGVVNTLKQLPVILHPRKGVQPFAAFKAKGMRMFAVGWPTKEMYSWERDQGKKLGHLRVVLCALPLFLLQFFLGDGLSASYMAILSGVLTILQVLRSLVAFLRIVSHEWAASKYLQRMTTAKLEDHEELAKLERDANLRKEVIINCRLKEEFFNDPIPERVQRWAKQAKMAGAADEESSALICLNCPEAAYEHDSDFSDDD